jgi:hypothetical protein
MVLLVCVCVGGWVQVWVDPVKSSLAVMQAARAAAKEAQKAIDKKAQVSGKAILNQRPILHWRPMGVRFNLIHLIMGVFICSCR